MRRANKISVRQPPSTSAPTTNVEGFPAFQRTLEESFLQTLLTNTFGSAFYADQRTMIDESDRVHGAMLDKDPEFAAKALVYARQKGYMRTQPIYGLARLASVDGRLFEQIFGEVILTPNDLCDFAAIVKSLRGGEGGRMIKRVAGQWMWKNISEYWAIKYGSARKDGSSYSLHDLVRAYHTRGPKAPWIEGTKGPNGRQSHPILEYLAYQTFRKSRAGKKAKSKAKNRPAYVVPESLTQIVAFENLKRATTDEDRVKYITEGRIPHEVATSVASSKKVWEAIVPQMPIFAVLRNLQTIERHGIMDSVRDYVVKTLTSEKAVTKSKILPFRFAEAIKHVRDPKVKDAVRDAAELSFVNIPDIEGTTAVFVDRSGSMGGYIQTAGLFGIATMRKANLNGRFYLYDDQLEEFSVSKRDSILTQAERIDARGGTNTALPMEKLLHDRYKVDNIVLITDEQQNQGCPFMDVFQKYKETVSPRVRLFVLVVGPYAKSQIVPNQKNVYFGFGWSDQALSFISYASRGWGSFVEAVRKGERAQPRPEEE